MQRFQCMPRVAAALAGAALWLAAAPLVAQAPASSPSATPPAAAPGAAVASAERYAEQAFEAYGRKEHARAAALYHEALAAAPSADIVYNLARVYDLGLHDRPLAMRFYARYLAEPGAVPSRIETARERLAALTAEHEAETAPPAGAALPARAAPTASPTASAPALGPGPEPRSGSTAGTLAIVAGSLGLIGVGVGVGYGVAAKSRLDESQRYCDDNLCTSARGVEAARSAERAANVATIGFGAGGALLALGTLLWLVADDEARASAEPGGAEWAPRVTPEEVSLGVSGSFAGL